MNTTSIFEKNLNAYINYKRVIINQGGTSSGKTYAILQLLLIIATKSKKPLIISVVSQTIPHLKLGAIRDFKRICYDLGIIFDDYFNRSELKFTYNNSIIEFFSTDNLSKVHGPRRDILFINECNNIKFDVYLQLEVRTKKCVFLDYNPVAKFWVHDEIIDNELIDTEFIHSTYLDNIDNLSPEIVKSIEDKRKNNNWWRIYGEGEVGIYDGMLFDSSLLKRFDLSKFDMLVEGNIIGAIDTKLTGEDYYCFILAKIENNKIYIIDVIFTSLNYKVAQEYSFALIDKYKPSSIVIETNASGIVFLNEYRQAFPAISIIGVNNYSKKESRILFQSQFIIDNFYFRNDYLPGSQYDLFLKNIINYKENGKNEHDDAPDCTAILAAYSRKFIV